MQAAAVDQRAEHTPGPLLIVAGEPVRFNPAFSICSECDDRYAARMQHLKRCNSRHLIELFAALAAKEPV